MSERTWHSLSKWSIIRLFLRRFSILSYSSRRRREQLLKFHRNIIIIRRKQFPLLFLSSKIQINDTCTEKVFLSPRLSWLLEETVSHHSSHNSTPPLETLHKIRTDKRMQPSVYRSHTHTHTRCPVSQARGSVSINVMGAVMENSEHHGIGKGRRKLQPLA